MRGYGMFMIYMLVVPATISLLMGLPGNYTFSFMPLALILYSLLFVILLPNLNWVYVLKFYRILVYIAAGFFLLQEFVYYTVGIRPTFYLPLEMYYEGLDVSGFSESRSITARSSSFFLEPAHLAQYILPYYCIVVCRFLKERRCKWDFFFLSFVILFLQSGSGYWGVLAIIISLFFIPGYLSKSLKLGLLVFLLLLIAVILNFLKEDPIVFGILSRFDEITSLEVDAFGRQSGFLRIWRGYFLFGVLEPINKIFGVGVGCLEYVANLIYIPGSRYEGTFMNGIQTLLVTGGFVGTFLFFRFLFKTFKNANAESIIVIVCLISLFFVEHMMFTAKMFLFIMIALAVSNNSNPFCNSVIKLSKHK